MASWFIFFKNGGFWFIVKGLKQIIMAEFQVTDGKEFFKEGKTAIQHEEQNH